jgi:hypothetical protein
VEIPAFGKKFAVTEENGNGEASADFVPTAREGQAASAAAPKPPVKRKRYVQRGSSWKRTRDAELVPGEITYELQAGSHPPRFIPCGRVKGAIESL